MIVGVHERLTYTIGNTSLIIRDFQSKIVRTYHIYTTGDVRQCELRVAIITDRDQESAFPLPDYAQEVYNK